MNLSSEHYDFEDRLVGKHILGFQLGSALELAVLFTELGNWVEQREAWNEWCDSLPVRASRRDRRENPLVPLYRPATLWIEGRGELEMALPMTTLGIQPIEDGYIILDSGTSQTTALVMNSSGELVRRIPLGGVGVASLQSTPNQTFWVSYGEQTAYEDRWDRLVHLDLQGRKLFAYDQEMLNCDRLNVTPEGVWFKRNDFGQINDTLVRISGDGVVKEWSQFPEFSLLLVSGPELLFVSHSGVCQGGFVEEGVAELRLTDSTNIELGDCRATARGNRACILQGSTLTSLTLGQTPSI